MDRYAKTITETYVPAGPAEYGQARARDTGGAYTNLIRREDLEGIALTVDIVDDILDAIRVIRSVVERAQGADDDDEWNF